MTAVLEGTIGTMSEALELYEALGDGLWNDPPAGWKKVGSGGTRVVYRAPSGVCYKICYTYRNDEPSFNDIEHNNFLKIARSSQLTPGWKVPRSSLHIFTCPRNWVRKEGIVARENTRVAILACEYIKRPRRKFTERDYRECDRVFTTLNMMDSGPHNAIKNRRGWYIIDAAENTTIPE